MNFPDLNPILKQIELEPLTRGLQILQASELAADSFPRLDTDRPALVFHLDPSNVAETARTLRVNYPASHPISLVQDKRVKNLTLDALGSKPTWSRRAILYLPPFAHPSPPLTVANIMARLRAPVGGCPWDLEQTHESITRALVEETYEVLEAISEKDAAQLKEELGDLFLHVLFQTQIARDDNEFALSDVGAELAAKLIRRHPHVFGAERAHDTAWVLDNWEKIKQEEKSHKGKMTSARGLDAGIPRHLPALTRAQKVSERVQRARAKSPNGNRQTSKVKRHAPNLDLRSRIARARDQEGVVGELLYEIARIAQEHGIDAERALHAATNELVQKNKEH